MLVLSRKCGERVVIPQYGIILTVLEVRGRRVRIGVTAPVGIEVHRQEVWQRLRQEGAAALSRPEVPPAPAE